jgi:hypothetical protein
MDDSSEDDTNSLCQLLLFIAVAIIFIGTYNVLILLENSVVYMLTKVLNTTADTETQDTDTGMISFMRGILKLIQYQENQPKLFTRTLDNKENDTESDTSSDTSSDSASET